MIPEILAPAGTPACALAAFDAGADAIYAGLKHFNARERTGNFTLEEMGKTVAYAHKNDKKVYVTLNTLIKESELKDVASYLCDLTSIQPDAIILQDIGLIHIIQNYFPSLVIHASTQMGIHNSMGIQAALELGAKRIIMERQTSLDELKIIREKHPDAEIEVFIHGALCCCISGTCLLSSWLGGWSGNRGKCKQPCRRRYHNENGNGFFLSVQDLCSTDILQQLVKLSITSLKIEGRLRKTDYITAAVSAYRFLLDHIDLPAEEYKDILPIAREKLSHTYGRKWSLGFYTGISKENLIKSNSLGASGQLCGNVISTGKNSVTVKITRRIHIGDTIRFQPKSGDEGEAFSLTKLTINGVNAKRALAGDICTIHTDKEVGSNDILYKIGESTQDYSKRLAALPPQTLPLDIAVNVSCSVFSISLNDNQIFTIHHSLKQAETHPVTKDILEKEFLSLSLDHYHIALKNVSIQGSPFLPASILKEYKKRWKQWLLERQDSLQTLSLNHTGKTGLKHFLEALRDMKHIHHKEEDTVYLPRMMHNNIHHAKKIARDPEDAPSPHEELILPFYTREQNLHDLERMVQDYLEKGGRTIRVTSIQHLVLLAPYRNKITLKTSFPLPICNSFAAKELQRFGISCVQAWIELEKKEMEAFAKKTPLQTEQLVYARPVLLSTRASIPVSGNISDVRGNVFTLQKKHYITQILSDRVMRLDELNVFDSFVYDLRNSPDDAPSKETGRFNFDYELK